MKKIILIASLLLCACGPSSEKENTILGKWYANINNYTLGISFNKEFQYETDLISPLNNGFLGIEAETGDYFSDQNILFFMPLASSCIAHESGSYNMYYDFLSKDNLRLASDQNIFIFERVPPPNVNINLVAEYGCFDNNAMTPHPIQNL